MILHGCVVQQNRVCVSDIKRNQCHEVELTVNLKPDAPGGSLGPRGSIKVRSLAAFGHGARGWGGRRRWYHWVTE